MHCDVLSAALKSMKKDKVIAFESMMPLLLMPRDEKVEIVLLNADYDARAPKSISEDTVETADAPRLERLTLSLS